MKLTNPRIRRRVLQATLAAGLALALVACSDSAPTTSSASGSASTTLRIGIPTDVSFATVLSFTAENQPLRRTIFDYLIDKDTDGSFHPALAKSWTWNDDQTQLVLTLEQGVKYHSGREFGPDDVLATIAAATADGSGAQGAKLLKQATGIEVTADDEVTVTFDKPFSGYLDALAMLPVIDSETFGDIASGNSAIGTGPYKLVSYTPGSGLELEKNEDYWRKGKPAIDHLSMRIITDSSAMLAAMRSGDLDFAQRMLPRDAAALGDGDFTVDQTEGFDVYVGVNTAIAPFDDVRVRQAVAYSLDRERIAEQVYSGFAEPSSIPWLASTPGVTAAQVNHYSYDVSKAKKLLDDAGATGATVTLTSAPTDPAYGAIQEIVQYGLEQAGFTVKTESYDNAAYVKMLQEGTMPGIWVSPVALTALGATTALLTALPLTAGKNSANAIDPEYGTLVAAVTGATSDDARAEATGTLTDYLLDQAFHDTVVQAQTPFVSVPGLTGVTADLTLAPDFTDAKLQ